MTYTFKQTYDPYYGFKIIKAGTTVILEDNCNGLYSILDIDNGRLLGTISKGVL